MARKKFKQKNNVCDFFLLSWKKTSIAFILFSLFFFFRYIFIENIPELFDLIGGYDNFLIAVEILIPLYFLISIIYTLINRKKIKKTKKKTPLLQLTWKKFGILVIAWVIAVVLHNLIYAFFLGIFKIEFEEPVFFLIATIGIPLYFLVSVVYSLYKRYLV